ncbi:MAG: carbohydrate binding protein with domain, partial [Verrucomicrobia bacterium]|nr:carbohydrate binding protein with domain [Verrucomicrobiota bacterium]
AGDLRIVLAESAGQPVAVLMQPVAPNAVKELAKTYSSPVGSRKFDRVEVLKGAQVVITKEKEKYTVEAAIPLAALGLKPEPALEVKGDAGYISSDAAGITNTARTYWSNQNTGLVNDLPGEAALRPGEWGRFQFSD